MARIGLILGSTRPTRISPVVGTWAQERLAALGNHTYEIIDLAEQNLPLFDEPASPKSGAPYQHQHTRDWSELVSGFDGFVVVLPEYNGGLPAVLKNAMDYLFAEWKDKPVAVVSYGFGAGMKAAAQFELACPNYGLVLVPAAVNIKLGRDMYNAEGQIADAATAFADYKQALPLLDKALGEALVLAPQQD
ncbi:NADPH-dependent FMN reductase [Rothia nasimurium]|uniref:NADPH-dependent FMN reductase n=1 Tax=Rothia nasimurium TaxID=85336 RepID=UPI001F293C73|nr:NAD(P)H-dependent oxidoreductase [Rothia nasimurium]